MSGLRAISYRFVRGEYMITDNNREARCGGCLRGSEMASGRLKAVEDTDWCEWKRMCLCFSCRGLSSSTALCPTPRMLSSEVVNRSRRRRDRSRCCTCRKAIQLAWPPPTCRPRVRHRHGRPCLLCNRHHPPHSERRLRGTTTVAATG